MLFVRFIVRFVFLLCLLACAAFGLSYLPVWSVLLAVLLAAVPVLIPLAVFRNLSQAHRLAVLDDGSWVKTLLSGAALRVITTGAIAGIICALSLPQLILGDVLAWTTLALAAPIFLIILKVFNEKLAGHVSPAFQTIQSLRFASRITTGILLVFGVAIFLLSPT